jgi:hypothetical protein
MPYDVKVGSRFMSFQSGDRDFTIAAEGAGTGGYRQITGRRLDEIREKFEFPVLLAGNGTIFGNGLLGYS